MPIRRFAVGAWEGDRRHSQAISRCAGSDTVAHARAPSMRLTASARSEARSGRQSTTAEPRQAPAPARLVTQLVDTGRRPRRQGREACPFRSLFASRSRELCVLDVAYLRRLIFRWPLGKHDLFRWV